MPSQTLKSLSVCLWCTPLSFSPEMRKSNTGWNCDTDYFQKWSFIELLALIRYEPRVFLGPCAQTQSPLNLEMTYAADSHCYADKYAQSCVVVGTAPFPTRRAPVKINGAKWFRLNLTPLHLIRFPGGGYLLHGLGVVGFEWKFSRLWTVIVGTAQLLYDWEITAAWREVNVRMLVLKRTRSWGSLPGYKQGYSVDYNSSAQRICHWNSTWWNWTVLWVGFRMAVKKRVRCMLEFPCLPNWLKQDGSPKICSIVSLLWCNRNLLQIGIYYKKSSKLVLPDQDETKFLESCSSALFCQLQAPLQTASFGKLCQEGTSELSNVSVHMIGSPVVIKQVVGFTSPNCKTKNCFAFLL